MEESISIDASDRMDEKPSEIGETENIIIDTRDWSSGLPEFIVQQILSYLDSPLDLVRSSVLSKNWFDATASFPILEFNLRKFITALQASGNRSSSNFRYIRSMFFKYADDTTSRFCKQSITAHRFTLDTLVWERKEADIIDRCIESIIKQGVQVFVIDIGWLLEGNHSSVKHKPMYLLPNILLSATSLKSLKIHRCKLPLSLMIDVVNFKSLETLQLVRVHIDEEMIKGLTTGSPLLKDFNVRNCYGFKRFCIHRHQNLRKVRVYYDSEVERIDIEAPNLCYLLLMDWEGKQRPSFNLASCEKLTTLSYYEYPSPNSKGFADFLSNFPFIKNLFMRLPKQCNNLTLSSSSLSTFVLHSYCDFEEIDIDAPNLQLFEYKCRSNMPNPLVKDLAESTTCMECYPEDDVDILWFHKLRRFLDKNNGFKVLKLHINATSIDVEELKELIPSPSYELEHVELEMDTINGLSVYEPVVEAVLLCCRPRALTLKSNFSSIEFVQQSHVVQFTYKKLIQQEDQEQTNIQFILSSSSKVQRHFRNMIAFLKALRRVQAGSIITFRKEQEARMMEQSSNVCKPGDCIIKKYTSVDRSTQNAPT